MMLRLRKPIPHFVRLLAIVAVAFFVVLLASPAFGTLGLGGAMSEKLIGAGGVASRLWISRSINGPETIGTGPTISVQAATDVKIAAGVSYATLHGTITNLNTAPSAVAYFEWGYAPGSLTNTTSSGTAITIYSDTISGFDQTQTVYYRFVARTDGEVYTSATNFLMAQGRAAASLFLWNLVPIVLAVGVLVLILKEGRPELLWVPLVFYVIAEAVVVALLSW